MAKLTAQQRWNRKHKDVIRRAEHKYYEKTHGKISAKRKNWKSTKVHHVLNFINKYASKKDLAKFLVAIGKRLK